MANVTKGINYTHGCKVLFLVIFDSLLHCCGLWLLPGKTAPPVAHMPFGEPGYHQSKIFIPAGLG